MVNFLNVIVVLQEIQQFLHLFAEFRVINLGIGRRNFLDICLYKGITLCFQRFTNCAEFVRVAGCRNFNYTVAKFKVLCACMQSSII